jgi:dihydroorotase
MLLKNARVYTGNAFTAPQDVLISGGIIERLGINLEPAAGSEIWDVRGACVSPGWMDVGVQTGDPGFEHREDLQSVGQSAAAGGFTAIAGFPNTNPAIHSKSEILYIKNKTAGDPVAFHPIGAVSTDCAGKDLAELFDMHAAGAIAFSDGGKAIQDAGLLLRAMQYVQAFDGLVMNEPHHKTIAGGGQMHEGIASTMLGMKGIPSLAETLMVQRDLSILEYTGGRLHLHLLSTRKSVEMVRAAKKSGMQVTASVAIANLCFTDDMLLGNKSDLRMDTAFNSNWKLSPPLRNATDVEALLEGLADGTIDFICSNHTPWDEESKNLEFPYAEFGMIGLETAFPLCRTYLSGAISTELFIEKMAVQPRRVLGLPVPEIKPGAPAELTVFDPDMAWTYRAANIRSKSKNTPFTDTEFKGKILGIISNGQIVRNT